MWCFLLIIISASSGINLATPYITVILNEVNNLDNSMVLQFQVLKGNPETRGNSNAEARNQVLFAKLGRWILKFNNGSKSVPSILVPDMIAEWIDENENTNSKHIESCDFKTGVIQNNESNSKVFLTICHQSVHGFLQDGNNTYIVHPHSASEEHARGHTRSRRSVNETMNNENSLESFYSEWLFNLTGDTFDIDDIPQSINTDKFEINHFNKTNSLLFEHEFHFPRALDDEEFIVHEENGYFLDNTWSAQNTKLLPISNIVAPQKWLKIAIGVDSTVINFHGKHKVNQYVLALMNIVSAIYEDPSLNANTKLVISRLIFYEHSKHNVVRPGNAKKSLENVNRWNRKLHQSLGTTELRHDMALWLTRSDIGGPSGYSPVGGTCDPKRSCALTRDEGLTSAFIIAHEMGHVLGMSHDGDKKSHNSCDNETSMGSIMSPMVYATFNKFLWSECSKREYEKLSSYSKCLQRAPSSNETFIPLNMTLKTVFDMDEQCRMEFGEGYRMCRVFDIIEPCTHLWCEHEKSLLVCKTKKGPPLEGTECGFGKWCVNGYCEEVQQRDSGTIPIILNPQNGGWSDWSPYGPCSRTCGIGVSFRTRKCDNPIPSYGGKTCNGSNEHWKICDLPLCQENIDLRAMQCSLLPKAIYENQGFHENEVWLPFERNQANKKCKLSCIGKKHKSLLLTNENLLDGTRCSYENEDSICVQGQCIKLGCDRKINSNVARDKCGVCGGNNSDCVNFKSSSRKRLKSGISKLTILPEEARHIHIQIQLPAKLNVAVVLKNRLNGHFVILIPNRKNNSEIMEGSRFFYCYKQALNICAHGPIWAELLILIIISNTEVLKAQFIATLTQYSNHKNSLMPIKKFIWIKGGWGPCSVACGGGKRKKTAACWNTQAKRIVKRKFCSLLQKPVLESEVCNTFSCNFQWIPGEWEQCSKTCGDSGVQQREVYCIPSFALNADNTSLTFDKLTKHMTSPNNCQGQVPVSVRSCNRKLCLSYWSFGNWSQCSVSCGSGIQIRQASCPHSPEESLYTCGDTSFSQQKRECHSRSCKKQDKGGCRNSSKYCVLKEVLKYCILKSFRKKCCSSCVTANM